MNFNLKLLDFKEHNTSIAGSFMIEQVGDLTAVTTHHGIIVQKLHPQIESWRNYVNYYKLLIKPSEYMLISDIEVNVASFLYDLPQDELFTCLLNDKLVGKMENVEKKSFMVNQCKISPAEMIGNENLISVISDGGALDIYVKVIYLNTITKFEQIVNLTPLHVAKYKNKWTEFPSKSPIEKLNATLERLALHTPTAMAWTPLFNQKTTTKKTFSKNLHSYAILIVAYEDGRLVFWQFNHTVPNRFKEIKPFVIGEYKTDLKKITKLHWQCGPDNTGLLIIGTMTGEIMLLPVENVTFSKFKTNSTILLSDTTQKSIDHLSSGGCNGYLLIYAVSQGNLLIYAIGKCGNVIHGVSYDSCNINITGMQNSVRNTLVLTTLTGGVKELKISMVNEKIKIQGRDIAVNINWTKNALYGMFMSRNNAIVTFITQQNGFTYKTSVKLRFYNYLDLSLDLYELFMKQQKICHGFDLLECLRITCLLSKKLLCNTIEGEIDYDNLPLNVLKKYYYIGIISESVYKHLRTETYYKLMKSKDLMTMIRMKYAIYLLRNIIKDVKELTPLVEYKREVAHFCYTYLKDVVLENFLEEFNLPNYASEILDVMQDCEKFAVEQQINCKICQEPLAGLTCQSRHCDNRCALSFVQILHSQHRCSICMYHLANESIVFDKNRLCPFCDGKLDIILGIVDSYEDNSVCPEDCVTNEMSDDD